MAPPLPTPLTARRSFLPLLAGACLGFSSAFVEIEAAAFAVAPSHRTACAARLTTYFYDERAGRIPGVVVPALSSPSSQCFLVPRRCRGSTKRSARRTETETEESRDDAKDLEEAREASALLRSITSALGWFGGGVGEDNDETKEINQSRGSTTTTMMEDETSVGGGFSFSWPWFSLLDPQSPEAKKQKLKDDIKIKYREELSAEGRDLTQDGFGVLLPVAEKVDELTGGWGLSYADLQPETPKTPLGQAFLATNAFYALAGLALSFRGELVLGTMTELAGIVSFWYHYSQLEFGKDRSEVRLALLTDYFTAGTALVTGGIYMGMMGVTSIPFDVVLYGGLGVACLTLSWVWEFGYPYLFWHSLWHILSAYAGYLVGQAHLGDGAGAAAEGWIVASLSGDVGSTLGGASFASLVTEAETGVQVALSEVLLSAVPAVDLLQQSSLLPPS